MLRDLHLADLFTLGNGFAGMAAILCHLRYLTEGDRGALWWGFALLPVALACDVLDGRVARARRKVSLLGQELDSLADLVSFGVTPAVYAYGAGLRGGWDCALLVYFVGCGISRLARYNATAAQLSDASGKVRYFEGTPIPSSMLLAALLAALFARGSVGAALPGGAWSLGPFTLHPLALLWFASGSAMISKTLRIPKP